mgnify:CR=1 FL=1
MRTQGLRACGQMWAKFLPSLFLLFMAMSAHSQDYILNGNAQVLGDDCFRLTNASTNQAGSIWFQNKMTLNADFTIEVNLNFGTVDDNGADGIAFVLQPLCTDIGSAGEGLGYQDITPSLAVEFDTYYNSGRNDPAPSFDRDEDHISLQKNGNPTHFTPDNLTPPFTTGNIEDGDDHPTLITWNTATQTLIVTFDGVEVVNYTGDIINEIFNGNDQVFWGFTAATGALFNNQQVCIDSISFESIIPYATSPASCPTANDGAIDLTITGPGPFVYSWNTGATSEDLDNITAGTYTVVVTDQALGCSNTYNIEVGSIADTIAPMLTCPENITILCNDPIDPEFTGMATAFDNCELAGLSFEDVLSDGDCADEFVIERRWTAIDPEANASSCVQEISTMIDADPPTCLNCPEDVSVSCGEIPEMAVLQLADNCDPEPTWTVSEASTQTSDGSCTDFGYSLTRTFVLADRCGNITEHIQTITILDEQAPEITCPADVTVDCEVPEVEVTGLATAADNCDPDPMISFSDVIVDGSCDSECTIERIFQAEDACGNTATCVQVIVKTAMGLISDALTEPIRLGYSFHTLTITEDAAECVVNWLPGGGGTSTYLPRERRIVDGSNCDLGSISLSDDGQIENPLLVETIILTLNVRINQDLGDTPLNSFETCTFHPILHQFLGSQATVNTLLYLANLGLGNLLGPVPLQAITDALHCINGFSNLCGDQRPGSMLSIPDNQQQTTDNQSLSAAMRGRELVIYPNPASNVVHFDLSDFAGQTAVFMIYNLQGQLIEQRRMDELPNSTIEILLDQYQPGLYYVAAQIEGFGVKSGEFLVEKR